MKIITMQYSALYLKTIKLSLMLLLMSIATQAKSIENINFIPFTLDQNWKICSHFKNSDTECETGNLPSQQKYLTKEVEFQSFTRTFIVDESLQLSALTLWMKYVDDTDEVFINDQLIGKTGEFLPDYKSGFRHQRLYLIPNKVLLFNRINQIKIHTYSSRNLSGILYQAPIIDDYLVAHKNIQKENYSLIIACAILLVLTVFQLFYFFIVKDNKETLYLSLYLIGFASVAFLRSDIPLNIGLDLSVALKLESFMLYLGIVSIGLFLFAFFELEVRRIYLFALSIVGVTSTFVIIWPYSIDLRLFFEINHALVVLMCFLIPGSAVLIALHKRRKYGWLLTITGTLGLLIMLYDSLMHSTALFKMNLTMYKNLLPIYSVLAGIIFSIIITHKYWRFFKGTTYDHLTGTLLRPAFFQRLTEEMQRSQRSDEKLLVAVIDIQQAKEISQNYGYSISNHLLTVVSHSLSRILRSFDLICRFSDEQFCIAASINIQEDADSFIQRIYNEIIEIRQPVNEDTDLFIDVTIGGVIYNSNIHLSVSHLLQDSGYALSKAQSQESINFYVSDKLTMHI